MEKFYLILSIIISIISILGSVTLIVTTISNLKARVTVLEKRLKTDEENTRELYNSRLEHSERISNIEGKLSK